jgi:hypothetical protein
MRDPFDPIAAARLLRELANEIRLAQGATRNGLFLELHRLHDTIFRLNLESHPALPPDLRGTAFNLEDPLPAPQVVRELNRLGSPLASTEIRNLYKHMNMARNNMAHESVIERVTISNNNMKRMVELANRVADVLDPTGQGQSESISVPSSTRRSRTKLYLLLGVLLGAVTVGGWLITSNPFVAPGITIVAVLIGGAAWLISE